MGRALKPCGTNAAYHRHLRRGEQPCAECLEARRQYEAARRTPAVRRAENADERRRYAARRRRLIAADEQAR